MESFWVGMGILIFVGVLGSVVIEVLSEKWPGLDGVDGLAILVSVFTLLYLGRDVFSWPDVEGGGIGGLIVMIFYGPILAGMEGVSRIGELVLYFFNI
jgi:hypothetical protein